MVEGDARERRWWESDGWAGLRETTRTRFAPSPTGDLHVGGALCAVISKEMARRANGTFVVRMEDLDRPRVVPGSAARILEDLGWLDCSEDEGPSKGGALGPYVQSARAAMYTRALDHIANAGMTYACDCSRSDIARVASAPHEGEDLVYPGTCRDKDPKRLMRRPPAVRFRAAENMGGDVDDFVLRRGDGVFAYQLAVSVDDLMMAISCVVRGADLAPSTSRQLAIMRTLGATEEELPRYVHLPLVVDSEGTRLAKRTPGARIRALREGGIPAREIVDVLLAHSDEQLVLPASWSRVPA